MLPRSPMGFDLVEGLALYMCRAFGVIEKSPLDGADNAGHNVLILVGLFDGVACANPTITLSTIQPIKPINMTFLSTAILRGSGNDPSDKQS